MNVKQSLVYLLRESSATKELADEVVNIVADLFKKWSIVGSIMRGHLDYHDLDFLITTTEISKVKKIPHSRIIFESDQRISIMYKDKLQVDFFIVPRKSWELGRIAWGWGKANLALRAKAKKHGCKLNQYELDCKGRKFYKWKDVERILHVVLPEYLKHDLHEISIGFFDPNSTENEGRHRLVDPKGIEPKSFRRWKFMKGVPYDRAISYIVGICKSTGKPVIQAVRFNKEYISEEDAKEWFEYHKSAIMAQARCPGYAWKKAMWSKAEGLDEYEIRLEGGEYDYRDRQNIGH